MMVRLVPPSSAEEAMSFSPVEYLTELPKLPRTTSNYGVFYESKLTKT